MITSASYLLLLSGLVGETLVGSSYSDRRFATIYFNLGLTVLLALLCTGLRPPVRRALIVGNCLVAVAWSYLLVVSSIV